MPPETETAAAPGGIFDAVAPAEGQAKPDATPSGHPATVANPPPETGAAPQRPDWLDEGFWNAEKGEPETQKLAQAVKDLRGKLSRGDHKPPPAPDGYVLPKIEGVPEVKADDPVWSAVRAEAHKAGISQQQLNAIVEPYLRQAAELLKDMPAAQTPEQRAEAQKAALEAELGKLGPTGPAVVRDVGTWIDGLAAKGMLSAEERAALRGISTAEGVRAMAKLRELAGGAPMPVDAMATEGGTEADARRMLIDGFAKKDDALVAKGRRILEDLDRRGMLRAS